MSVAALAEVISGGGMLPERRAEKVLRCARLGLEVSPQRLLELVQEESGGGPQGS